MKKISSNTVLIFLILVITNLFISWLSEIYVYTDSFFISQIPEYYYDEIKTAKDKFSVFGYILIPILLLLKTSLITILLSVGAKLSNIHIEFSKLFHAVILSEFVFSISNFIYLANIYINIESVTIENIQNYYPLSLLSFYGVENVNEEWVVYPLTVLNLFQVLYLAIVSFFISRQKKLDFFRILNFVIPSYGFGLLLWISFVAFLTFLVT